jgi:hypothetical protein
VPCWSLRLEIGIYLESWKMTPGCEHLFASIYDSPVIKSSSICKGFIEEFHPQVSRYTKAVYSHSHVERNYTDSWQGFD